MALLSAALFNTLKGMDIYYAASNIARFFSVTLTLSFKKKVSDCHAKNTDLLDLINIIVAQKGKIIQ